jgi:hypothetical protein
MLGYVSSAKQYPLCIHHHYMSMRSLHIADRRCKESLWDASHCNTCRTHVYVHREHGLYRIRHSTHTRKRICSHCQTVHQGVPFVSCCYAFSGPRFNFHGLSPPHLAVYRLLPTTRYTAPFPNGSGAPVQSNGEWVGGAGAKLLGLAPSSYMFPLIRGWATWSSSHVR